MSRPSNKPPPSGLAESQPFVTIRFRILQQNGNYLHHDADCLVLSVISGLKEDFQRQLGPPDNQNWYYKDRLMSNDQRLKDYGINGDDDDVLIEVKPT